MGDSNSMYMRELALERALQHHADEHGVPADTVLGTAGKFHAFLEGTDEDDPQEEPDAEPHDTASEDEPEADTLALGTRVRVKNGEAGILGGRLGKVDRLGWGHWDYRVKLDDAASSGLGFNHDELEVADERAFQVGDRVRVKPDKDHLRHAGQVGTVIRLSNVLPYTEVRLDGDGFEGLFKDNELEPVELRVGAKVRVRCGVGRTATEGLTGTVTDKEDAARLPVDPACPWPVRFDDPQGLLDGSWYRDAELEVIG